MLLKKIARIIRENTFQQKKKKPGLKFNPGLALIGLRTTGSWLSCLNWVDQAGRAKVENEWEKVGPA